MYMYSFSGSSNQTMLNKMYFVVFSILWILTVVAPCTKAVDGLDKIPELSQDENTKHCEFQVDKESLRYWMGKMTTKSPDAIHFNLTFNHPCKIVNMGSTGDIFHPTHWTWTYNVEILHWPLDHGLLSFHLLDKRTLTVNYIRLLVTSNTNCSIILGSPQTTHNIAKALAMLVDNNNTREEYPEYDRHFFCYMHFKQNNISSWANFAALYLRYPAALLLKNYRCSQLNFNYSKDEFELTEYQYDESGVWSMCVVAPYVFGVLFYMYFPILLLAICDWLSKDEKLEMRHNQYTEIGENGISESGPESPDDTDCKWIMLDGSSPLTFFETFGIMFSGFRQQYPRLASRIVRFCGLVSIPLLMLPQLIMYSNGVNKEKDISIEDLMKMGNPSNFLGLLSSDVFLMKKRFVPCLGGPIGVLVIYFVVGFMFIVLPRSLKQILENGIPKTKDRSPLFLSGEEIITLSGIEVHTEPGYQKAAAVCKCAVYLIINPKFWRVLFTAQGQRFLSIHFYKLHTLLKLPLYIGLVLLSALEIVLCVLLYAFPLFGCLCITMRGAIVSISNMNINSERHGCFKRFVALAFIFSVVVISWVLFAYCFALIILQVFTFLSQVAMFCCLAVFTYPSESFGYLFFAIIIVFYIISSIAEFNDAYHELLHTAVDISEEIDCKINDVVVQDDCLYIYNFVTCFTRISVNGILIDMPKQAIHSMGNKQSLPKTICKQGAYGIPKELFYKLVAEHKPIHVLMLNLFIKFALLAFFVKFAWDVTSRTKTGQAAEISEVMHVMFVVVLGAVPKIVEVALFHQNKTVQKDIETRKIKDTIKIYWLKIESRESAKVSNGTTSYQTSDQNSSTLQNELNNIA